MLQGLSPSKPLRNGLANKQTSQVSSQVRKKELELLQYKLGKGHGAPWLYKKQSNTNPISNLLLLGVACTGPGFPFNEQDQQLGLGDVTQSAWGFTCSALKPPKEEKYTHGSHQQKQGQQTYANIKSKFNHLSLGFAAHPPQILHNLLTMAIHIQHSLEQYNKAYCSYTASVPFYRWSQFFKQIRGGSGGDELNSVCCNFHLE